jgi:hypothetical protein
MKELEAKNLVDVTFTSEYREDKFRLFIRNLFHDEEECTERSSNGSYIPEAFRDGVVSYKRLFKFVDLEGMELDVLAVKLKSSHTLENARTMQRNFVARYLNGSRGGVLKDAALVAFYADDYDEWRFSLVRMDYVLDEEKNKIKKELTPARRFSFLVGGSEKTHTARKQLFPILQSDTETTLTELEKAFNIESVTKEFFDQYKELFLRLTESLDGVRAANQAIDAHLLMLGINTPDLCKKLLGQIVFLYFLQKKGWLGVDKNKKWGTGDKNYLRSLLEDCHSNKQKYFDHYLEPLFYEALATERDGHYYSRFDCRIPFLNGGLFEPTNDYSWQQYDFNIPNELFSNNDTTKSGDSGDGILDVFDRYNFTVREDESLEKEVAVDPEMLGKVFENLLEVKDRKSKGAFYTPREIVHYMCQESLINYLDAKLNIQRVPIDNNSQKTLLPELSETDLLTEYEAKYNPIVSKDDITDFIYHGDSFRENDAMTKSKGRETSSYRFKLSESIRKSAKAIDQALADVKVCDPAIGSGAFPVGIMHEIVRARLTLLESGLIKKTDKTNAYEYKRCAIQQSIYGVDIEESAIEIAKLRLWLSLVVDEVDMDEIKPLPNLKYKIIKGNSLLGIDKDLLNNHLFQELERLKELYFDETRKSKKRKYERKISNIIKSFAKEGQFDFEVFFSEVFSKNGGFDIVIGNPPYMGEGKQGGILSQYKNHKYYKGKGNIWFLFGCVGVDILKKSGCQCYIAPSNWITAAGASKLREKMLGECKINNFIDFGNYKVFETADELTMIYVFTKDKSEKEFSVNYRRLNLDNINKQYLSTFLNSDKSNNDFDIFDVCLNREDSKGKIITFTNVAVSSICSKILNRSNYLFKDDRISNGIHHHHENVNKKRLEILGSEFSLNEGIFVISDSELSSLQLSEKDKNLVKPHYTTKQLGRYYGNINNNEWVIYTDSSFKDKNKIHEYTAIKEHLDKFVEVITSDNSPYGLHRAKPEKFFKGEKIVSLRKCSKRPVFTYTDFDCYVSATFFVIKPDDINLKYLTAVLNSKLIAFWLWNKGKRQGNNYQVDKGPLMGLPIVRTHKNESDIIDALDRVLEVKKKDKKADISTIEQKIDQLVYQIYALSPEEIQIIEDSVPR